MIETIVSALKGATNLKVYPFYTEKLEECIVYEWTPQADDGAKTQGRLTVRIKSLSLARIESIGQTVKETLLSFGDEQMNGAYVKHNGGGMLLDADTRFIDAILYFDFTYKSGGF